MLCLTGVPTASKKKTWISSSSQVLLLDELIVRRVVVPLEISSSVVLRSGEPVIVCGHPHGNTLSMSVGMVLPDQKNPAKVAHSAGTQPGSSGWYPTW